MSRLRFNNSIGALGGSLTSTATTVTFASSPGWPTVVAPDIVPLVIDPPGSTPNASFEIVWVTAYTAGTTTATIVRGQESTSPVSHASGAQWMMAPTAGDFPIGLSYTPATAPPPSRAYRNAALTYGANGFTKVPLDTVSFDPNGYMSTSQGRYNVPVTGYYQVEGAVDVGTYAAGNAYMVAVYKSGVEAARGEILYLSNSGTTTILTVSDVVQCNAGDYLELYVYNNNLSTGSLNVGTSVKNYLSVVPLTQQSIGSQITPVVARASRTTALTLTNGAYTKIPVDTLTYDTGSNMDVGTNHRFNCPVTGYYQVSAGAQSSGGTQSYAAIYRNGTIVAEGGSQGANNDTEATVSDILFCKAGDYIELYIFATSTTLATDPAQNFLTVALLQGVPGANLAAARAYRNAALSVSANNWNKVPLDTKSFDPNGNMDVVTNGRYNVPAAGPYLVCAAVNSPTDRAIAAIYRNGSLVSEGSKSQAGSGDGIGNVVDIVQCNAGDYIELWYYPFGASSLGAVGNAYLNFLSVTPLVSAVASTPGFSSSGSQSAATNVGSAYKASGSPSLTSGVWTKVAIDTVSFDPAGAFDVATNHRYNVPVAGYYQVSGQVAISSTTGIAGIYKNGSLAMEGSGSAQGSCSGLLYCNAGDYLELYVLTNGTGTLSTGGPYADFLSVALIQAPSGTGNANALPAGASYQNGVINSTDLAISALSINTSTGALTFTLASAVPVIVKDASGLLIPVTFTGSTFTLIPPTLPTTSNSRVIGVEIDANGQVSLVSGASVSGQQSTALTLETNTPAVTNGHLRVDDIGVYNNAGAYNFSNASTTATQGTNWVDRRPWVRGFQYAAFQGNGGGGLTVVTSATASWQLIGGTFPTQMRVECSGVPLRVTVTGFAGAGSPTRQEWSWLADVDGAVAPGNVVEYPPAAVASVQFQDGSLYHSGTVYDTTIVGLSPGSHLIRLMTFTYAGGAPIMFNLGWTVEEILRQNVTNGAV